MVKDTNNIIFVVTAFTEQLKIYGEFLRDNDKKRDELLKFYLALVVSTIGFCVYILKDILIQTGTIPLLSPIIELITVLLLIVFLIGILTFHVLIRFRILHTYYVKLMNRNRGFLVKVISDHDSTLSNNFNDAWKEHLSDTVPPFMKKGGLEQSIMFFCASINSTLIGFAICLYFGNSVSQNLLIYIKWVNITLFPSVFFITCLIQLQWMRYVLLNQDRLYQAQLTKIEKANLIKLK